MEEKIGLWWHRFITRLADDSHPDAAIELDEVARAIGMLYRAGGGHAGVRVVPVSDSRHNGPRAWLQRIAGSGQRAAQSRLDAETLALPPRLAVFPDRKLNRDLYLWLAALAAVIEPSGDWIADNRAATARALQRFAGLRARHERLLQAHLAQRPRLQGLRGEAALLEAAVQSALRGDDHGACFVQPQQVAPVWLWIAGGAGSAADTGASDPKGQGERPESDPGAANRKRRRSQRVEEPNQRTAMLLPSKIESIMSWSEFVKLDRGTDDDEDPNATAAADDMDQLSLAQGDKTTAARVKFDLDLPSASVDDLPLGPGRRTPEWDWRKRVMLPDHCAIQCMMTHPAAAFVPRPALRATSRKVRRRLEVLRAAPRWSRAQEQGDAIDLDAWVRYQVETGSGAPAREAPPVYARRERGERSMATLLLADLSLSTDAYATSDARVIDVIRDALYVFGEAISGTGDAFEMLGFSSVRRQHVRIQHLKGFDEGWNPAVQARIGAIKPGYYTRMGAAMRDAIRRLSERPERLRLLLILTDGKPNDLDIYEGRYGLEDTRHAVQEAREAGLTPFCVTIDERAHDYLPTLFGEQGYALVHRPQDLVGKLTQAWVRLAR